LHIISLNLSLGQLSNKLLYMVHLY